MQAVTDLKGKAEKSLSGAFPERLFSCFGGTGQVIRPPQRASSASIASRSGMAGIAPFFVVTR